VFQTIHIALCMQQRVMAIWYFDQVILRSYT